MTVQTNSCNQSSFCCTSSAAATTSAHYAIVMDTALLAVSISVCLLILRLCAF